MVGCLAVLTVVNVGMQVISILLSITYYSWATMAKWFKVKDTKDLETLKKTLESVELYVNAVEYSSMAMVPLQICVILALKCCCVDCEKCKKHKETGFCTQVK